MGNLRQDRKNGSFLLALLCGFLSLHVQAAPTIPASPQPIGELAIEGGGETGDLAALWVARFQQLQPDVQVSVTAWGSRAGPPGLAQHTYDLALMSRPMSEPERRAFTRRNDYQPTSVHVAHGAVMVYVARGNPLQHLTLAQLDAIFSVTYRCSQLTPIRRWKQLGIPLSTDRDIHLFGPDSATGIYDIFRQRALCGGDFRPDLAQLLGGTGVDVAVAANDAAIGFAEMGPKAAGVKPLALYNKKSDSYVVPTHDTIISGQYPLSHAFYLYFNQPPGQPPNPAARAFVAMVLSPRGQEAVKEIGLLPLTPKEAKEQQSRLP